MSIKQLQLVAGAYNLTATVEVFSFAVVSDALCQLCLEVTNNVNIAQGIWELSLFVDGFLWDGVAQTKTVNVDLSSIKFNSHPFVVRAGQVVSAKLKAPGVDTSITVSSRLFDLGLSSTGSGLYTVVVTAEDDASDPLESVKVRLTKGMERYLIETNVLGEATFQLSAGTWEITAGLPGYSMTPTSIVVSDDDEVTITLDPFTITPSAAGLVTGYFTCYDELGIVEENVTVTCAVGETGDDQGIAFDSTLRTATSAADGLVEFPNLFKGATYIFTRGDSQRSYTITIPSDASDPFALDSIIGEP